MEPSPRPQLTRLGLAIACAVLATACDAPAASWTDAGAPHDAEIVAEIDAKIVALVAREQAVRQATDWRNTTPGQKARGADPIAVERTADGRFIVALRGADELLFMDAHATVLARAPAPPAARAIAVAASGDVFAVGELDPRVFRYRVEGSALVDLGRIAIEGATSLRAVAVGAGAAGEVLYVVDRDRGEVVSVNARGARLGALPVGAGALAVERAGDFVVAISVEGHRTVVAPVDARGVPDAACAVAIENQGPFWSLDARVIGDELWVATSLVEDHPLERTAGSFQFIDSFVRVDAFPNTPWPAGDRPTPRRVLSMNVSEHGLVVPKAVRLTSTGALVVAAAGSSRLAVIDPRTGEVGALRAIAPGAAALSLLDDARADVMLANPLLDAVVRVDASGEHVTPVPALNLPPVADDVRLGEALVLTTLIAPRQLSEGGLSRFTCETCHFEGGMDGRIHSTGRGDVHATTKPLFGLANNTPLFTRALDRSLSKMAHNEFRVANAESGQDPWFTVTQKDAPWLAQLGVTPPLSPERLRFALVQFLFALTPETHARTMGRMTFSQEERAGMALFAQRCERCHASRLVADDASSRVPQEQWEALVLSPQGPLVWARDGYEQTGVTPLVHERGARPSSLRRILRKSPYFTNGAARILEDVLSAARFDDVTFLHAGDRAGLRAFTPAEARALAAFLSLL